MSWVCLDKRFLCWLSRRIIGRDLNRPHWHEKLIWSPCGHHATRDSSISATSWTFRSFRTFLQAKAVIIGRNTWQIILHYQFSQSYRKKWLETPSSTSLLRRTSLSFSIKLQSFLEIHRRLAESRMTLTQPQASQTRARVLPSTAQLSEAPTPSIGSSYSNEYRD